MGEEIKALKRKLKIAETIISNTKVQMELQRVRTRQLITGWKLRLNQGEEHLNTHKKVLDEQMKRIVSELYFFEGKLRKEKIQIQADINERDRVIEQQQEIINKLLQANYNLTRAFKSTRRKFKHYKRKHKTNSKAKDHDEVDTTNDTEANESLESSRNNLCNREASYVIETALEEPESAKDESPQDLVLHESLDMRHKRDHRREHFSFSRSKSSPEFDLTKLIEYPEEEMLEEEQMEKSKDDIASKSQECLLTSSVAWEIRPDSGIEVTPLEQSMCESGNTVRGQIITVCEETHGYNNKMDKGTVENGEDMVPLGNCRPDSGIAESPLEYGKGFYISRSKVQTDCKESLDYENFKDGILSNDVDDESSITDNNYCTDVLTKPRSYSYNDVDCDYGERKSIFCSESSILDVFNSENNSYMAEDVDDKFGSSGSVFEKVFEEESFLPGQVQDVSDEKLVKGQNSGETSTLLHNSAPTILEHSASQFTQIMQCSPHRKLPWSTSRSIREYPQNRMLHRSNSESVLEYSKHSHLSISKSTPNITNEKSGWCSSDNLYKPDIKEDNQCEMSPESPKTGTSISKWKKLISQPFSFSTKTPIIKIQKPRDIKKRQKQRSRSDTDRLEKPAMKEIKRYQTSIL